MKPPVPVLQFLRVFILKGTLCVPPNFHMNRRARCQDRDRAWPLASLGTHAVPAPSPSPGNVTVSRLSPHSSLP